MKPTTKLDRIGSRILFWLACAGVISYVAFLFKARYEQLYPEKESNYVTVDCEYCE